MRTEPHPDREDGARRDSEPASPRVPASLDTLVAYSWRLLVVSAAVAAFVFALWRLRLLVFPVIIAILLSTLLTPPAAWLRARGWPPLAAAWAVMMGALALFVGVGFYVTPQVAGQLGEMRESLEEGVDQVLTWLADGPLSISEDQVEDFIDQAPRRLTEEGANVTTGIVAGAVRVAEVIAGAVLMLVLLFFFVKDGVRMFGWFSDQFPEDKRVHVRAMGERAYGVLGSYLRGTAIIAFVDAVFIGIVLVVVGVPLVVPLVVLTFLGGFFPIVGATVAGAVAALVALVSNGLVDALLVTAGIVVVQQTESNVLQPVVMGRAVRLHPVAVLLALTGGVILAGIPGAFLAVPLTAAGTKIAGYLKEQRGVSA